MQALPASKACIPMLRNAHKITSTSSSLKKRDGATGHNAQVISCIFLIFAWCGAAHAGNELEQWRKNADQIRQLAENDIPAAYMRAQRLQAELPADATPADRVRALNLLARTELYSGRTDVADQHAQQAFELANKQGDQIGQAEADLTIALNAVNQARIGKMSAAVMHSMDILDGVDRPDLLGESMLRTSMMYRRMDQVEDSVSLAMQTMEIARRNGNALALTYAYQGLAAAYDLSEHDEKAREYYLRMREQARVAGSGLLEMDALLGAGALTVRLGNVAEGERMIHEAISRYRAIGGPFYVAHALVMLATCLNDNGRSGEALPVLGEVERIYEQGANKIGLWWALKIRSASYQALGKIAQARADAEKAYQLAREIGFALYLHESAKQMASIAAARGEHQRAYRLFAEADTMAVKNAQNKANQRIVDLARRYQSESKQREIDRLNRHNQQQADELKHHELEQRWLWTVLGGSVVILAGASFFLVRLRRSHRRLETLNTEVLQAKNKLQATLDTIPDLLFELGLDGRYYDYHSPRTDLLASPADYLLGKTVPEVIPSDAAAIIMSALREAHEHGFSTGKQFELALPHGNFWFELSVASKPVTDGEEPRLIALSRDITERKHLEATALQREQEFRVLVESSTDLIFRYDKDCRRIYTNPAVAKLTGKPADSLLNMTSSEAKILSAEEADKLMQMIRQVLSTGLPAESEVACLNADGKMHYFHNRYAPEFSTQGEVVGVISIARDITERKQAERRLWLMDFALNQVREAVYIIDLPNHNFISVNDEACRALGYAREELLTMDVLDIDPDADSKEMEELQIEINDADVTVFERHHKTKDGRIFPVEINAKVFEYEGRPTSIALARDITERKRIEKEILALNSDLEQRVLERTEELRRQTRYLRALIDTLPMMAWLKDKESRFLVVNQAMALASDHSVDDMIGKSDLDFWPREHAEVYRTDDLEVMATRRRKTMEELFVDAHNVAIWLEIFKAPVLDEDGSVLGTVGIARDISDRRVMERARESALAEAERLAQLRSQFMARMSHELRTPLNGIMGYAQILLGENRKNERQSIMLGVIQQSGEYLLSLINDILDFAKIEAGKQELSLNDIHLPRFLRNLASLITIKAEKKGLAFICDIATDVPTGIRADETRLRQVLLNLLSNAVKFTEQGQVSLKVTVLASGPLRFEVQDSGIGIDSEQLETIFQAFEQAGSWQHRSGGTGLGLPISRELVRLMGSEIFVTSRVGEGSTFWFDFDAPVVEIYEDIMIAKQHVVGYQGLRRRVLVVDDVDANRALLINILTRLGLETAEAVNGRACLDSVTSQSPDLILLDMVMPEMDGLETARHLRRMQGFEKTPIIAVSASASGTDVNEAMEAGVNVFLFKPVDIKRLVARIGGLLKLDWIYASPETGLLQHRLNEPLVVPPLEEMAVLHRLALEGSMRDIIRQAKHLEELDDRYRPFAGQLRQLSEDYQSKAVLDLVEHYIDRNLTT